MPLVLGSGRLIDSEVAWERIEQCRVWDAFLVQDEYWRVYSWTDRIYGARASKHSFRPKK